ncbi:hypothetical protein BG003_008405 [Podila horticola]|nr:hypothetical protein BG003_008405 [Podila horticola]
MAHAVTRSLSSESTTSTSSTCSSSSSCSSKSVQFSRFIKISFTYPEDEYDRTALEPAKLTFSEASELLQLRIHWKNEMNSRLEALEKEQQKKVDPIDTTSDLLSKTQHEDDEATVPSMSPPSSCSSSACSSPEQEHPPQRFRTPHRLLSISSSCSSSPCAHSSPPCSPVLSHHDSCSSSEDEYEAMASVPRFQKLGRVSADENDSGLMYRYQYGNKDNVQC